MTDWNLQTIDNNGLSMRVAENLDAGKDAPLVLLLHGWPESWYSWRHQLPALAAAGYRVAAPDMRGYGGTDAPEAIEDYDIHHIADDVTGLIDHYGDQDAVLVGHDWGAIVTWQIAQLRADRVSAVGALSVPYRGRGPMSLVDSLEAQFGENFFYILYFQQPGVAEAEFDKNPEAILRRLYASPKAEREPPSVTDPKMSAGGWIPRLGNPKGMPDWLTQEDLGYYVGEFRRAGFRRGINYYRNFRRNWETTPELAEAKVEQPALFLAGTEDMVVKPWIDKVEEQMRPHVPNLRRFHLLEGYGHWIQQEAAEETNRLLIDFLHSLD